MIKSGIVVILLFFALGGGMLWVSFSPEPDELHEKRTHYQRLIGGEGREAPATVTRARSTVRTEGSRRNRRMVTVYCPVYTFDAGRHRLESMDQAEGACKPNRSDVQIGAQGIVLYDPARPSVSFVKNDATHQWLMQSGRQTPWLLVAFGGLFTALGVLSTWGLVKIIQGRRLAATNAPPAPTVQQ